MKKIIKWPKQWRKLALANISINMKVVLSGTSNCVLKGRNYQSHFKRLTSSWKKSLWWSWHGTNATTGDTEHWISSNALSGGLKNVFEKHPAITYFQNSSYGASGSIALGDHVHRIDFSQFDFCILEYCVNEEILISMEKSTAENAINSMCYAIDTMSRAGCVPILLILPSSNRQKIVRSFEEALHKIFVARGVPVFNGYRFAKRVIECGELSFSDLFADPMHIQPELAAFIGAFLVGQMHQNLACHSKAQLVMTDQTYSPLKFVDHSAIEPIEPRVMIQRRSRLVSLELLVIQPGAEFTIRLPSHLEVIGITYNAARSIGQLIDCSTGDVVHTIDHGTMFSMSRKFSLVTLPIDRPITSHDGMIKVKFAFQGLRLLDQPPIGLELFGFVCRSTTDINHCQVLVKQGFAVDLDKVVSERQVMRLSKLLKPLRVVSHSNDVA